MPGVPAADAHQREERIEDLVEDRFVALVLDRIASSASGIETRTPPRRSSLTKRCRVASTWLSYSARRRPSDPVGVLLGVP